MVATFRAAWATVGGGGESVSSAAALAHVGSRKVTEVERESESGGASEVEIPRTDGSTTWLRDTPL